ncbi:MAG: tetratricopeptide repeat protein, partial [Longimicrobiales bacterium]|nr:tetratricopeptide repeat protein [Longimicrobiales bacterium]
EYDRSLELFDRLISTAPRNLDARVDRARVLAWRGDTGAALQELDNVLEEHPDHAGALEARGLFQAWAGDYQEALSSYETLLSINPGNAGARLQQARVLSWASDFQGSQRVYEELLTEDPGNIDARLGLARTLAFADDLEGALAQYDLVLERSPEHMGALQGKARTLAWADRLMEGEALIREALAIDDQRGTSWIVLGQILQWQGRDAAALEALERAVELAPTDGDAHDQLRSVRLALSPAAGPTAVYEWDSDGNRMITTSATASFHPVPRLQLRVDAYRRGLEQSGLERESFGGGVTGVWVGEPGWRFTAGVGGIVTDVPGAPTEASFRAGVRSPDRNRVRVGVDVSSQTLDETAALAQTGVRFTSLTGSVRWKPAPVWRVDVAGGWGHFDGTEENSRISGSVTASRRVGRVFFLGGSLRTFGYDKDLDDGYFDPSFYGIAEITGGWRHLPRPWTFLVEAAPGIQQVTRDGDLTPTLRGSARIGYLFAPRRELSLSYGYSSAGLLSFSTGSSDYRYSALIVALSWVF